MKSLSKNDRDWDKNKKVIVKKAFYSYEKLLAYH